VRKTKKGTITVGLGPIKNYYYIGPEGISLLKRILNWALENQNFKAVALGNT